MVSNISHINIDDLLFDLKNPRLSEFGVDENTPQDDILFKLWDVMGAEEIYMSIAASGFFQHEPLIVIPASITGKHIVIEGNRRLAAVKAILNTTFLDEHGPANLPIITNDLKDSLTSLPCIKTTREEAWRFIGFKHVNGAAKWGSFAKAKFIEQVRREYNMPIADIAKQIGDTTKIAIKLYQAYMVIDQAEKMKVFSLDDIPSKRLFFSHLYNGLNYDTIKSYIGLQEFREDAAEIVPREKSVELGELLGWMFGSKREKTKPLVVSQNPDLKHLAAALGSKLSIAALRAKDPLEVAYELSQPDPAKFEQSLNDVHRSLYNVQKYLATGFDGKNRDLLQTALSVAELADSIFTNMKKKFNETTLEQPKKRSID